MEINKIYNEDCLEGMKKLEERSIDLTVTSPPYDNLRKYNGFSWDFEGIANELYRVTKDGGVVVWIVGDATVKGSETGTSFIQALYFKEIGFNLHDTMIYRKLNPMPLTHNRYDPEFEYMFVFSKGKPNTFHPIMIECSTAGSLYNYSKRKSSSSKESGGAGRNRNEIKVTNKYKRRGNIWGYTIGNHKSTNDSIAFQHPAIFPERLAEDHILSWSNSGDTVLDPFMGSGTTAKMALLNNRSFIGFELSKEYCDIANKRIKILKETNENE